MCLTVYFVFCLGAACLLLTISHTWAGILSAPPSEHPQSEPGLVCYRLLRRNSNLHPEPLSLPLKGPKNLQGQRGACQHSS